MALESLHVQREAGVEMVIAIDSTRRGPALGGCRWRPFPDLAAARREARGLARAMTCKAALAGLSLGGGKMVVRGDPGRRTREQLAAVGRLVDSLEGRYITAADMGTGEEEMAVISEHTRFVVGRPRRLGGCGEPAPFTALGVCLAMQAAMQRRGRSLEGARVAIQGVGSVGGSLAQHLLQAGATLIAADIRAGRLSRLRAGVEVVSPGEILGVQCDLFSPCGPPGVIDARTARQLRCGVVCGSANNPLAGPEVADLLEEQGILYVPDFLASAGGLIHLAVALEGGDDAESRERLCIIPENLRRVMDRAEDRGVSPAAAAEQLASAALAGSGEP